MSITLHFPHWLAWLIPFGIGVVVGVALDQVVTLILFRNAIGRIFGW